MITFFIGERSCYDEGKRTAETLAMDYHRGAGVEVNYENYPIGCILILVDRRILNPGMFRADDLNVHNGDI